MFEFILLLLKLFGVFFKIGIFTFGGGYAMIPLIQEEVMKYNWVDSYNSLIDFIGISQSTPGAFAVNIGTFIGFEQAGILGAIFATLGVVLPSFIIILIIAMVFKKFKENPYVKGLLSGISPVVPGIIMSVAISFILRSVFNVTDLKFSDFKIQIGAIIIFIVVFSVSKLKKRVHPIYLVLISAVMGLVFYGFGWF